MNVKEIEEIIDRIKQYYSTDVFMEWTKQDLKWLDDLLKFHGRGISSLSAYYGRHFCDLILRDIKKEAPNDDK